MVGQCQPCSLCVAPGVLRLCIHGLTGAMPAPRALSPHSLWVTAGVGGTRRTRGVMAAPRDPPPPVPCHPAVSGQPRYV